MAIVTVKCSQHFGQVKPMSRTEKILNQMIEDLDLVIIKAKAQLDYIDGDELSDLMRDER